MSTKKFAIYGCQHNHLSVFIEEMNTLGHEFVGIYEPDDQTLANTLAEKYDVPILESADQLKDSSISVIGCASANHEKIDVIEWCEQNGKHIMVDKPIVVNRSAFMRLESVVKRGNIQIGMLLTERFRASIHTLKNRIDAGVYGEIVSISMRKPHRLNPASRPAWFFSREKCGSIIVDLFIHDFDLVRYLTNQEVQRIESFMGKNILPEHDSFYDIATAQLLLDGNVSVQLYADWHTADQSWTWGDCRIFIIGTKGTAELRLSGDPQVADKELYLEITDSAAQQQIELEQPTDTIIGDFMNRINTKQGNITHADLLKASELTIIADEKAHIARNL